ncbi:replication initiator [Streptomyces virginiae]|uniref:replication initiator n=1 Tax=Streptomyces virginiae TaxID=1961 RepID=UPI0036183406
MSKARANSPATRRSRTSTATEDAVAHMLGFRGHFSTKTRAYSTTLGVLRAARAAWHRRHTPPPSPTTLVLTHWAYDGTGLTPDLERLAALINGGPTREQAVTAGA